MKDLTLGKIGGWIIGLIALGATASRTVHFLSAILPTSELYFSWLAVAILDFGLIFWLNIYLSGSKGQSQRAISMAMILISGIGIALTTSGDMFLMFDGAIAKNSTWGLLAMCAVIGLLLANIAAKVAMSIANPVAQRAAAESELSESIEDKAVDLMRQSIPAVATELATAKVQAQIAAIRQVTLASLPSGTYTPALAYGGNSSMPSEQAASSSSNKPNVDMAAFSAWLQSTQPVQPAQPKTYNPTYAADSGSMPETETETNQKN